ncbi:elongation factor G [bacterium]|nr:elongation factor G [bacterium]
MLKDYRTENIRNILLAGHGHVGKTTLNESLLTAGGVLKEPGSIDKGTTISDFDEEEIARKVSLRTTISYVEYQDRKLNFLDTPGSPDFIGEIRAALHVVDSVLLVVDSEAGMQIEAEKHARLASEFNVPCAVFVNKMNKENANFEAALESISQKFGKPTVPVWLPLGSGSSFTGIIDLLSMKAFKFEAGSNTPIVSEIPADREAEAKAAHEHLIESAAEGDDSLTEKFLDNQILTSDEIAKGLNEVIIAGRFIPVTCGCGNLPACASALLDFMIFALPHAGQRPATESFTPGAEDHPLTREPKPEAPFSGFVFKTLIDQYAGKSSFFRVLSGTVSADQDVLNVNVNRKERFSHIYAIQGKKTIEVPQAVAGDIIAVAKLDATRTGHTFADPGQPIQYPPLSMAQAVYSIAVNAVKKGDDQKMATALARLCEEDPTLTFHFEPETRQSLLSALGDLQIDITLAKLKKRYNIEIERSVPRVLYKETIQKNSSGHHKHRKQSGGHGQFGEVYLELAPRERGAGYHFEDKTVGGCIPKGYIPGVEKGVKEALQQGAVAKYPVIDVNVKVTDGSYHDVDSSEMSFKIAGRKAFLDAMQKASPILLEPVMQVKIHAHESYMGAITSDLNSRRGRILSMGTGQIEAHIPQAELQAYSKDLKSMTSGTASFEMDCSHFQPISGRVADNVIKQAAILHGESKEED